MTEETEEVVIIQDRQTKIDQLVINLLRGEKSLSYSSLKAFSESPNDFIEYVFKEKEQTEAMLLGLLIHCLILEPDKYNERYFSVDETNILEELVSAGSLKPRGTKKYKEWLAVEKQKAGEKQIVDFKLFQHAKAIAGNVRNNRASRKVLSVCPDREKPIQWVYKNFPFRGFIDASGESARADIKLMPSASPKKAQRTIIDMKYHLQAAMYNKGEGTIKPYYIIAVDRKGGVSVHRLHKHLLEFGFDEYDRLINQFNDCLIRENFNHSYDFYAESYDGIYVADKPAYLY